MATKADYDAIGAIAADCDSAGDSSLPCQWEGMQPDVQCQGIGNEAKDAGAENAEFKHW